MALSTNTHSLAQLPALRLLAHRALTGYDLAVTHLKLLAMENNSFFRVNTADGVKYALRISVPGWRKMAQIHSIDRLIRR